MSFEFCAGPASWMRFSSSALTPGCFAGSSWNHRHQKMHQAMPRIQRERVEKGDSQIVLGDELTADYAVAEHARHKVGTLPRPERGEEIGRAFRAENRASVC